MTLKSKHDLDERKRGIPKAEKNAEKEKKVVFFLQRKVLDCYATSILLYDSEFWTL